MTSGPASASVILRLRKSFAASLFIFFAGLTLAGCSNENTLTIQTTEGERSFTIELVDTPELRARGLMFRQEMRDDHGMLFDFKAERDVSFWMKNTFIPLDMIFITAQGVIHHVHANARPHDETSIPSNGPVRFVLEINAGLSQKLGITPGNKVIMPSNVDE